MTRKQSDYAADTTRYAFIVIFLFGLVAAMIGIRALSPFGRWMSDVIDSKNSVRELLRRLRELQARTRSRILCHPRHLALLVAIPGAARIPATRLKVVP